MISTIEESAEASMNKRFLENDFCLVGLIDLDSLTFS
jgi:hypothetical protein